MSTSNFVKLCTMTVNLDDVSSVPHEPTPDAAGVPTLNVKMRGPHSSLALTDPDDQAAILEAVGQKPDTNEFLKKHAEAKKEVEKKEAEEKKEAAKKAKEEATAAKHDAAAAKHETHEEAKHK